jgi:hypothetical protein
MRAMRWYRRSALLALPLLLAGVACTCAEQAGDAKVTLKVAKYDELIKTLNGLKGQVVVADFWADT